MGLGLLHPSVYLNDVSGWLPISAIEAAAGLPELHSIRAALARTNAGAVTSQGDFVQGTVGLRTDNPSLTGTGITVGILSDSYNCYAIYAMANSGVPASGNHRLCAQQFHRGCHLGYLHGRPARGEQHQHPGRGRGRERSGHLP